MFPAELKVNPQPVRSCKDFLICSREMGAHSHIITSVCECAASWSVNRTWQHFMPGLLTDYSPLCHPKLIWWIWAQQEKPQWLIFHFGFPVLEKSQLKLNLIKIMLCVSIFIISTFIFPTPVFHTLFGFLHTYKGVYYQTQFGYRISVNVIWGSAEQSNINISFVWS